jgi:hypothetical protein
LDFIREAENQLTKFVPEPSEACKCIKVIHIPSERPGFQMDLIMDGQNGLGYLTRSKA